MVKNKHIYAIVFLILINIYFINATQTTTYVSTSTNAYAASCLQSGCNNAPTGSPPTQKPNNLSTQLDFTGSTNINANDGTVTAAITANYGYLYLRANLSNILTNLNTVTSINYTFAGYNGLNNNPNMTAYYFNYNTQEWVSCGSKITNGIALGTQTSSCLVSGTDSINSSNLFTYLLFQKSDTTGGSGYVDFLSIAVNYNALTINSPLNNFLNSTGLTATLNTSQDTYTNTLWYTWNNGISNNTLCTSSSECQSIITVPRNNSYNLTVYANDSSNNIIYQTATNITFGTLNNINSTVINTLPNYYNSSNRNITFTYNISDDDDYIKNISIYIDTVRNQTNMSVPINKSINNSLSFTVNNIPDGLHSWYIESFDSDGQRSNSTNQTFRVDTTGPTISIIHPTSYQGFNYKDNININSTRSDPTGINSCWWSNSSVMNYTLSNPASNNFTVSEGSDGTYNVTIWCNDSLNNIGTSQVFYVISQDAPAISLNFPPNNEYLPYSNVSFNFTAIDSNGLDTCQLWGNFSGTFLKNYTWRPTSGVMNYTYLNLSDNSYLWNVWCNDTTGSSGFNTNFTLTVDTLFPNLIIDPAVTTPGTPKITFTSLATDTNLNNCSFSVYNTNYTIDNFYENISVDCNNLGKNVTPSDYGTYILKLYARDLAGNENSINISFTTSASSGSPTGGGGGGTTEVIREVNVTKTSCGDGICQREGNDAGLKEDFYSCAVDCPGANVDSILFNCIDNNPNTDCVWGSVNYQYAALFLGLLIMIVAFSTIEDKKTGKQVSTVKYIYLKSKLNRRRR